MFIRTLKDYKQTCLSPFIVFDTANIMMFGRETEGVGRAEEGIGVQEVRFIAFELVPLPLRSYDGSSAEYENGA